MDAVQRARSGAHVLLAAIQELGQRGERHRELAARVDQRRDETRRRRARPDRRSRACRSSAGSLRLCFGAAGRMTTPPPTVRCAVSSRRMKRSPRIASSGCETVIWQYAVSPGAMWSAPGRAARTERNDLPQPLRGPDVHAHPLMILEAGWRGRPHFDTGIESVARERDGFVDNHVAPRDRGAGRPGQVQRDALSPRRDVDRLVVDLDAANPQQVVARQRTGPCRRTAPPRSPRCRSRSRRAPERQTRDRPAGESSRPTAACRCRLQRVADRAAQRRRDLLR